MNQHRGLPALYIVARDPKLLPRTAVLDEFLRQLHLDGVRPQLQPAPPLCRALHRPAQQLVIHPNLGELTAHAAMFHRPPASPNFNGRHFTPPPQPATSTPKPAHAGPQPRSPRYI